MAIATTSAVLHDGARNLVVQITGVSDGSGQESGAIKVSPAAHGAAKVAVRKITYDVGGGGMVKLAWDALTPVDFAALHNFGELDYGYIGAMKDPTDGNGDILLSTAGFELDSSYTITLEMVKKG